MGRIWGETTKNLDKPRFSNPSTALNIKDFIQR
ncbi:hypothetical protein DAD78_04315 [Streptococcus agalactiae]|uniref:Uncharacterized protein n=1 Tax=Streptococcus agalactiae serotype V (strain ATCC BAA-611 / 2603 V/R) TaxID=208435 RepID=Q8DXG5_STRA5|nr:hypothetical protein SAG1886 [Streptococcus agalactiae 2603V/R]KAA9085957.1 hypothetical protein F5L06_01655 [Streptococcus agalactiae]MQP21529.1 hypothetical protein [Streptococcus agalactiae]QET54687.1 hypothetical protein FOB78_11005 [Streptococcus agalactiae]QIW50039.1 hypothetical protein EXA24_10065 [Streptococcus agalactiae]